jgi:uncharacterized protein (UPF0548 family)
VRESGNLEDQNVDGMVILRSIFRIWMCGHGLDRDGPGYGQLEGTCESGNETSCFINP